MATAAVTSAPKPNHNIPRNVVMAVGAGLLTVVAAQHQLGGTAENFFEHKFVTSKHPDDLA